MKKIIITIVVVVVAVLVLAIAAAGMYKFNYLSGQPGYDVDGNKIQTEK